MKMKEFLTQINENTIGLQLKNVKKETPVLLHIRGHIYAIHSIVYDPFNDIWRVTLISALDYVSMSDKLKVKTLDDIHYLYARHPLLGGIENKAVSFPLIEIDYTTSELSIIPTTTIDIKAQTIKKGKLQEAANSTGVLYYFK